MLRQRYCADNFGWKTPVRAQVCSGSSNYAARIPECVYWHDVAEKKGIENTFMRLDKQKGDIFRGAVVFDFSYQKLMPEEGHKSKIAKYKVDEHAEPKSLLRKQLENMIKFANDLEPDFEGVKTLGDIQDYIATISVDSGTHPSNPWMNEAIDNGFLGGHEMSNYFRERSKSMGLLKENDPEVWEKLMKTEGKKRDGKDEVFMKIAESWMNEAMDDKFLGGPEMTNHISQVMKNVGLLQENDPGAWEEIIKIAEKMKSDDENGVFMKKAESCDVHHDAPKKGWESAGDAIEKIEAGDKKQRLKDRIREKRLKRQGK